MEIIILPGLDGTGLLLTELKDTLSQQNSVSVISYPPSLYRYDDLRRWVETTMPNGDFVLVAESFSGPLAIMLSSQKPSHLKGIVFVATFATSPVQLPFFFADVVRFMPIKSTFLTWLMQPLVMGRWSNHAFTRKFRSALQDVPVATLAGRLGEVLKVDTREELRKLSIPFLYLRATKDRLVPPKISQDFDLQPGSIAPITGPHFVLQSNARQAAEAILKFVTRLA